MPKEDQSDQAMRLQRARFRRGFASAKDATRYFGWNYNTYSQHERGLRGLKGDVAERYAHAFRVSTGWLLTGDGSAELPIIPIMGIVGPGAEITPEYLQTPPDGLEQVEIPHALPAEMVGFEVRGDSMTPRYDDGDVIVCYQEARRSYDELINEWVVVRTTENRRYLKRLMPGPQQFLYNLESFNARTIVGVSLDWVGEIWTTVRAGQVKHLERDEPLHVEQSEARR